MRYEELKTKPTKVNPSKLLSAVLKKNYSIKQIKLPDLKEIH